MSEREETLKAAYLKRSEELEEVLDTAIATVEHLRAELEAQRVYIRTLEGILKGAGMWPAQIHEEEPRTVTIEEAMGLDEESEQPY